ncbi:MAG: ANTAR domain-containing protein [Marmoricola sp.]|nr:ANTAR domain-containing protein [Marmoricola sp.]
MESAGERLAPAASSPAGRSRAGAAGEEVALDSLEAAQDQVRQLLVAMERRTVTGQATGIIMERFRLSADEAFAALARLSQEQNVKLFDLATRLTQTGNLPGLSSVVRKQ